MIFLVFFLLLLPMTVQSADFPSDTCYGCHDAYKNSRHGNVSCMDCHRDIKDLPHDEKLEKPACAQCHSDAIPASYSRSIHGQKNVKCSECHDTHSPSKEKKTCLQCHGDIQHKMLPSAKKHLNVLNCGACHNDVQKSSIETGITVKKGKSLNRNDIDRDNNNILDSKEWNNLLGSLREGSFGIDTKYFTTDNAHSVKKRAAPCNACHMDGPLFRKASLNITGTMSFNIPVDPKIFIPDLPSIEQFKRTLHGVKGVQCSDCHSSQAKVSDALCINCHKTTYDVYKKTVHASSGATVCTDCHDPHSIKTYKELNAGERLNVCSRCHRDYIAKHKWLPNTELHFNYLECSTCHSPESVKSIVFSFKYREGETERTLTNRDMRNLFPGVASIPALIDTNKDLSVASQELSEFFIELKKRLKKDLFVGSSLIVTKVHHDYSSMSSKEKVCGTCHSEEAPFYESMYLIVPEEEEHVYLPVKGTMLSALPASLFVDLSLLGDKKIKNDDIQKLFRLQGAERLAFMKELGLKWIDFFGITLIGVALIGIILHIIGRIIWRR